MKNLISLSILLFSFLGFSQHVFVPFKVGTLFGISDEKGNIKIKPSFDYINISSDQNNYFLAYKNGKSSCIHNDNIIINDKNYFGYYPANDLIIAVEKTSKTTNSFYSNDNEQCHLYTNTGDLIFKDYYMYIGIYEVNDQPITSNVLLYLKDMEGKYSVMVYNKKKKKIIQTFFKKASDVEITFNSISVNTPFSFTYLSQNDIKKRITLEYNGDEFLVALEETLPNKKNYDYSDRTMGVEVVDTDDDYLMEKNDENKTSKIEVITIEKSHKVSTKKKFKRMSHSLSTSKTSLVLENNKYGVKKYKSDELLIPIEYDAIYSCDFRGHHLNGYILKKDFNYGLYVTGLQVNGRSFFIPCMFKYIPILEHFNYVKKDFHIIGMYNEDGEFLYYANSNGFIYAKLMN